MAAFRTRGIVAALATAMAVTAITAASAGEAEGQWMAPRHGVSFDVGSKRAVSYFLSEAGLCRLTVVMGESNAQSEVKGASTRLTLPVVADKTARIDTAEGVTLEFRCAPSTKAMSVKVLDQVAVVSPSKG